MYTIEELVKASLKLGYSRALVAAALKLSGKDKFTLEEAQEIIKTFAETEVK